MENQGRRPNQIDYSEKVAGYSFLGIVIIVIALVIFG